MNMTNEAVFVHLACKPYVSIDKQYEIHNLKTLLFTHFDIE